MGEFLLLSSLLVAVTTTWVAAQGSPPGQVSGSCVSVVGSFPANKGPGWKQSIDVAGAVGPRHVVDFDVAAFVVHDKETGEVLLKRSTREFWGQVEPVGELIPQKDANDARMLHDPLTVIEVFGFTAEDCHFINDTSIGARNMSDYNMNTVNGFRFARNRFSSAGPGHAVMEMTQRNSRHGVWEGNTFEIVRGGFGEYAADIRFTDNTFTYQGDGNQCVHLVARDTSFTGNTVIVEGSSMGVCGEGPPPQSLTIADNTFRMGTGAAVMIAGHGFDGSTVTGNTITGSGAHGIHVASPEKPNKGGHVIHGNTTSGYREELRIDLKLHPGTVLSGSGKRGK